VEPVQEALSGTALRLGSMARGFPVFASSPGAAPHRFAAPIDRLGTQARRQPRAQRAV